MMLSRAAAMLTLSAYGCAPAQPPKAPATGDKKPADERQNDDDGLGATNGGGNQTAAPTTGAFLDAVFDVSVKAIGITICSGDVPLKMVNLTGDKTAGKEVEFLNFGDGEIDCGLLGKVKLKEILNNKTNGPEAKAVSKEDVVGFTALTGPYEYDFRPLLPAFLTAERAKLTALNRTWPVTARNTQKNETYNGETKVAVEGIAPYKPEAMQRTFNETLSFTTTNTGYDGMDKLEGFMFETISMKLSMKPVVLLHLELSTPISDVAKKLLPGGGGAQGTGTETATGTGTQPGVGGLIVGLLTKVIHGHVVADLKSAKGIEDTAAAGETDDDGEKIGN